LTASARASLLLTTEALIAEKREKKSDTLSNGMPGMGGGF
jgi:hypothetical protein